VKSVKEGIPFDRALGQVRSARKKVREEHPVATGIGEAVGFVGSGMGATGIITGAKNIPRGVQAAVPYTSALKTAPGQTLKNLPKEMATGAGTAATEAGFTAGAKGEDAGAAAAFGLMFGVAGGTLPALFTGTKNMLRSFRGSADETTTGSQNGWEKVKKYFMKDGEIKPTVAEKISHVDELGMGDDMMAVDLLDEQGLIDAGALLRKGDPDGKVVGPALKTLKDRLLKIKERSGDYLAEAMGFPKRKSMLELSEELQKKARDESKPLYNKAFYKMDKDGNFIMSRGGLKTISDPRLDELFMNPEFRDAFEQVVKISKRSTGGAKSPKVLLDDLLTEEELAAGMKGDYSIYTLDKVKKFLDKKYKGSHLPGADPVTAELAGEIKSQKRMMLEIIGEKDEAYGTARGIFKGEQEIDEARQLGEDLFKRGLNGPDAQFLMNKQIQTPSELAQFKTAAYNSLVDMIERSGKEAKNPKAIINFFEDPQNLQKIDLIIDNPEAKAKLIDRMRVMGHRIYVSHHLTGGSQTATRLAAEGGLAQQAIRAGTSVARKDIPGMVSSGIEYVKPGMIARQADEQGQHIFKQGTGEGSIRDIDKGLREGLLTQSEMRKRVGDPRGLLGIATGGVATGSSYTQ